MDAAKNSVKSFLSKSGKHDTTVHENMAPAVTEETVNKHQHEEVGQAIDREVHQDHYHTTVQPVKDDRKLDTQHHHNVAETQHRNFEHGNDADVQHRLKEEQAKFRDTTTKGETRHTTSEGAAMVGEHTHHHVHENIQPVIQRQTIEPHVVHTTVPIHETHHSAAQHHTSSALPAVSMDEFKTKGGSLTGRDARSDFFEGEPKNMAGHNPDSANASHEFRNTGHVDQHPHGISSHGNDRDLTGSGSRHSGSTDLDGSSGLTGGHHGTGVGSGVTGSHHTGTTGTGSGLTGSRHTDTTGTGSGLTGSHHTGSTGSGTGLTGSRHNDSTGLGSNTTSSSHTHSGTDGKIGGAGAAPHHKPTLMEKLNPKIDSDGDGKAGFMK